MELHQITGKTITLLCRAAFLLGVFTTQAQATSMTIVTANEPPLSFEGENGAEGIITDVVSELIKRTGTDAKIEVFPWKRAYQTGPNAILFTAGRTIKRENLFHWVGPAIKKQWVFITKKGSLVAINSLNDARKVGKIGAVRDDSREHFLKDNGFTNIEPIAGLQTGYKMLLAGRLDMMITADIEVAGVAAKIGVKASEFEIAYNVREIGSYIVLSKNTPAPVVEKWLAAFEDIKKDGTFAKIGSKWAKLLDMPLTGENGVMEIISE